MFGLGLTEILIIALVAFLVFGPEKFPSIARNFLKFMNELKSSFSDVQSEFYDLEKEVEEEFHNIKTEAEKDLKLLEKSPKQKSSGSSTKSGSNTKSGKTTEKSKN